MTRRLAIAALIVLASPAVAETPKPAAVEKVATASLAGADAGELAKMQLAKDRALMFVFDELDEKHLGDSSYSLGLVYLGPYKVLKEKRGTIQVGSADGVAWFALPYHVQVGAIAEGTGDGYAEDHDKRVGGVLVAGKDGSWEVFGEHFAEVVPDAKLMAADNPRNEGAAKPGKTDERGDKELDAVVQGWLAKGFSGHATTLGTPIANGTSASESASGTGTAKLTEAWDNLHLVATAMTGHLHASGKIGFVTATVQFKRPKVQKAGSVRMGVSIVLVKEGSEWRWASILFSA